MTSRGNLFKSEKVPNHLRKIPNLVFPSPMARAILRKNLRPIRLQNAYEPLEPQEHRYLVIVPLDDFYRFVKQVCTTYVQMASIFFASMYIQIMASHKVLGFSNHFICYYIFLCARRDKRGPITCWTHQNFASTSTKNWSLGQIIPCGKVCHHSRLFWGRLSSTSN